MRKLGRSVLAALTAVVIATTWVLCSSTPVNAASPVSVLTQPSYGFSEPFGTALDEGRNVLFVADRQRHRVLVHQLGSDGLPVSTTPTYVIGQPDATTYTSGTTPQKLNEPTALAFDPTTRYLYVVDRINNRVLGFNTTTLSTNPSASFVIGQPNMYQMSGATDQSSLYNPRAVAIDVAGRRLFVSEINNSRVTVFDITTPSDALPASSVLGASNFTTIAPATTASRFAQPSALAYDSATNRLYVGDTGAKRVLLFDVAVVTDGEAAVNVLGQSNFTTGSSTVGQATFGSVRGLGIDDGGRRLFVADGNANRVLTFDITSVNDGEKAVDVIGQTDYTGASLGTANDRLNSPAAISFDRARDRVVITDAGNNRLVIYSSAYRNGEVDMAIQIQPSLAFTVTGSSGTCDGQAISAPSTATALPLGTVSAGSVTTTGQLLTVASNAGGGVVVTARTTGPLRGGSYDIAPVGGTNAAPSAFGAGEKFGYSVTDATLAGGTADRFTTSGNWAAFDTTGAPVASMTGPTMTTSSCLLTSARAASATPAGVYFTTLIYTAIPTF